MANIKFPRETFEKEIGKLDEKMQQKIAMFGTTLESFDNNEIEIEVFPNRPDLLSYHGFKRSFLAFLGKKTGLKKYKINPPEKDYKVTIDKSVKKVRPFTACAIIKGLVFDDEKIKEIIDIQEKLHLTLGRNRKKAAIGIYPLEEIKLPIKFLAKKPEEIKFQPLEFQKEINGKQILSQHPAGRDYGDLLKNKEQYPIFIDSNNEILSMPPIINSHKTGKITEKTKEVFIECSGFNLKILNKILNILVTTLADMGGKIYAMKLEGINKISPDLTSEKINTKTSEAEKLLGIKLSEKEIKILLEKMGYGYKKEQAEIPSYRADILHPVDIYEDIAIAYGYEKFEPEIPKISTIGQEDEIAILKRKITDTLIGLNLQEISNYHLSTKEKQFKKIGIKEFNHNLVEVLDSKTENNVLRNSLLAQSIQILSENSDAEYPQKIFELGKIFENDYEYKNSDTQINETEKLCISLCHEKANFTEIKQILDYLMRMFNKEYEIKETEHPSFIKGRCGEIFINKNNKQESIGILGEISPTVLKNNKIKMPVSSLEISIKELQ